MRTSDERVEELRRLYKEAYNQELSIEEAREMAHRLVELYKLLMRPLPRDRSESSSQPPPAQNAP